MTTLNTIIEEEKEAQKTNEDLVDSIIGCLVKNSTGFDTIGNQRLWHVDIDAFQAELPTILTLKDEAHRKEMEEIRKVVTTRTRKLKIGQNEYARNQLNLTEKQIDDHNDFCDAWEEGYDYAKDEVLKALTPTKEVTEELPTNH